MVLQNSGKFRSDKGGRSSDKGDKDRVSGPREGNAEFRLRLLAEQEKIDELYGFKRYTERDERAGFLINMHTTEILNEDKRLVSAVDYYFIEEDGTRFKVSLPFKPYFYILAKKENIHEVSGYLLRKYMGYLVSVEVVSKEDLDLPNHLIGLKQKYLKLSFLTVSDLMHVRQAIMPAIKKNKEREKSKNHYSDMLTSDIANNAEIGLTRKYTDQLENIIDIREFDVPYHVRVSIDCKIFCGLWYSVVKLDDSPHKIVKRDDLIERPDMVVLAYDIETTKLPLKFPDAQSDQIMMISYMINGQGFLITNREIISADVEDFEYTPKGGFKGFFTIYNEPNEVAVLARFFDHIREVKPHIFVSYNGDFFDWPFIETRAAIHQMDMAKEIGFSKNKEGVYCSRPALHMDCLCWVKRDSYLPVGSHNLKAVAKAKLRYDPVELDPEVMCLMAAEKPQVMSNYSVSDAVATYYLYMKYVHPFIFALCTIIPQEPDEVLRKGSGTLCESLLMVEAFHANIIFPNKQESEYNKLSNDGRVLDQETYVGGHVEALESGVFRADIPAQFRIVPSAITRLQETVEHALKHAIVEEEKIPLDTVTNLDQVAANIREKLQNLHDTPLRVENPVIYHLDVGAMYPNIILTNRLQPSAMVNEETCAACDFNKPGAKCQRNMAWMWRGEVMPANRNEFQRIKQQLELEKFPPAVPGSRQRAFHELSKEEQAAAEKKRLADYCRKAYKKTHVTRIEERTTTICQKENSFYVDTVRAFRDRRYEYKGLSKVAKKQVSEAIASGDAEALKSAKNREVIYDSLQLAHKCILNSFYGYVMRKGARWHSMEMAGIVCFTGANIITKAREIIEQVGRPLELDTDGIWCILPASFPENYVIESTHPKKAKVTISYPNALLNSMVKEYFTNDQYHELIDPESLHYEIKSENSIFFEVDGPYLAMVLPASKEEGKRLKKRYAVFNFDGSLAELKGFEVKRRGELQLVKIFQSSVFEAFLKGSTLEECYASVARVANYWLDVLYSKGVEMTDSELFELISENRSMSKKLEDYGGQKSTSISTAKRLAEFLGDQMVKDAGLACKFIISRKPEGSPVTDRAIPLAIFQSEPAVKRHFLRKWLKDSSIQDIDIRDVLDWDYYIERLGGTIQKIITIPAAMQGVSNPVPRVRHPEWLHKKLLEKTDVLKQRRITELFAVKPKEAEQVDGVAPAEACSEDMFADIEDLAGRVRSTVPDKTPVVTTNKRKRESQAEKDLSQTWREVLGPPPPLGTTKEERLAWLQYQKKKWAYQLEQRAALEGTAEKRARTGSGQEKRSEEPLRTAPKRAPATQTIGGFLKRTQRTLLNTPWQILQLKEINKFGLFKLWVLVGNELHQIKLVVPRIFYVNQRNPRMESTSAAFWEKCNRTLPHSRPMHHLYKFTVPEELFKKSCHDVLSDISTPDIEGVYEAQVTLEFRALLTLGCVCAVDRREASRMSVTGVPDSFTLNQLQFKSLAQHAYLESLPESGEPPFGRLYLYYHRSPKETRGMLGLFLGPVKRALIVVVDSVRTNLMPYMPDLYQLERNGKISRGHPESALPPNDIQFEIRVETDLRWAFRLIQSALREYKTEKKGPAVLAVQSVSGSSYIASNIPEVNEFPVMEIRGLVPNESLYSTLEWQRVGARFMVRHYLCMEKAVQLNIELCRYFHLPIGNLPSDPTLFGADLFYARNLVKNNFVLWCSSTDRPDLGGMQGEDKRQATDLEESNKVTLNVPGCYTSICVELEIDSLAVNTLLQAHHIHDIDGDDTTSSVAFDAAPQATLADMVSGETAVLPSYDESALCAPAVKILRIVVASWLRDVSVHKNEFADMQIVHFYRWLRSPNALLYDPAIRRTMHNLMKKMFLQLVAEFKRMGSIVVYGNFNKILLCTNKRLEEDALGYVDFVSKTIRNKELFHSVQIIYQQCWKYLMWLDPSNHAGVKGKLPAHLAGADESSQERTADDDKDGEDGTPPIVMNWNLTEYLPQEAECHENFAAVIAGYILKIYLHLQENFESLSQAQPKRPLGSQSQVPAKPLGVGSNKSTEEFAKELIIGEMAQKLFSVTEKIYKKFPSQELDNYYPALFPVLPGSHLKLVNPALEFVKAVCKALSLDSSVEAEVAHLKKSLLLLINVGNFSDEAEWRDPSISFILPELICKACNHSRDIDLCKDHYTGESNGKPVWLCPMCGSSYNSREIERYLVESLNKKGMAHVLQDLQCHKCLQIKMDNMSRSCTCAGQYRLLLSKEDYARHLKTLIGIAKHYEMPLLTETVEWVLTMSPDIASLI